MPMASNRGQQQQQMGQTLQGSQGLMPMYPGMAPQPMMGQVNPYGSMGGIGMLAPQGVNDMNQAYPMPMNGIPDEDPNMVDQRPTNMEGSAIGSQAAYRPTMGPLTAYGMQNPMSGGISGLPNSIENQLPPSLKRPTQGSYKNFK